MQSKANQKKKKIPIGKEVGPLQGHMARMSGGREAPGKGRLGGDL